MPFLMSQNGCTPDGQPRWAFVRWLLRLPVRGCGVRCWRFFIFNLFFNFFVVAHVKTTVRYPLSILLIFKAVFSSIFIFSNILLHF
jgi:hypothetical protein